MKVLPLTLIVLHSIDALALPKLRPLRAIKRASLPPPPPPPPRAAAAALRSALALKGGSLDFSTQVAPVLGATIANAMFASGFPEVLGKRKEGKLGKDGITYATVALKYDSMLATALQHE